MGLASPLLCLRPPGAVRDIELPGERPQKRLATSEDTPSSQPAPTFSGGVVSLLSSPSGTSPSEPAPSKGPAALPLTHVETAGPSSALACLPAAPSERQWALGPRGSASLLWCRPPSCHVSCRAAEGPFRNPGSTAGTPSLAQAPSGFCGLVGMAGPAHPTCLHQRQPQPHPHPLPLPSCPGVGTEAGSSQGRRRELLRGFLLVWCCGERSWSPF